MSMTSRISLRATDVGRLTKSDVVMGTMSYLAPEAAQGMGAIDRRSDLYALGVILYEMLAGRHPFTAGDPMEMFNHQVSTVPPPIRKRSPGVAVPPALETIVRRLLAKDPDARYQHARGLVVALDAALPELEAGPRASRPSRRTLVLLSLALLALLAFAIWVAISHR